jgi:hypothetical protein
MSVAGTLDLLSLIPELPEEGGFLFHIKAKKPNGINLISLRIYSNCIGSVKILLYRKVGKCIEDSHIKYEAQRLISCRFYSEASKTKTYWRAILECIVTSYWTQDHCYLQVSLYSQNWIVTQYLLQNVEDLILTDENGLASCVTVS